MQGYAGFQIPGMPHLAINTEDSQPIPQASSRMVPYMPAAAHQSNFPPQSDRDIAPNAGCQHWDTAPEGAYATRIAPQCLTRVCFICRATRIIESFWVLHTWVLQPSVQSCSVSVSHNPGLAVLFTLKNCTSLRGSKDLCCETLKYMYVPVRPMHCWAEGMVERAKVQSPMRLFLLKASITRKSLMQATQLLCLCTA